MPRPLEIKLELGGLDATTRQITQLAAGLDKLAAAADRVMQSLTAQASGVDVMAARMEALAQSMTSAAGATEKAAKAAAGAGKAGAPAVTVADRAVKGDPSAAVADRFLSGPYQRLGRIAEQRAKAEGLADSPEKEAILNDLKRAEFLAQRSIKLHERRMEDPEESLNLPGLLELFKTLNNLMRGFSSGNAGVVVQNLTKGIQLLKEAPGGLNVEQKLARSIGRTGGADPGMLLAETAAARTGGGAATAAGAAGGGASGNTAIRSAGVGRAAMAVGVAAAAIGVVALAVSGLRKFYETTLQAAARLSEFDSALANTGGTARELASVRVLGFGPGQVSAMADSLRQSLDITGGNPLAFRAAAGLGLSPQLPAALGGPTNNAALLERAIRAFEKQTPEERLRTVDVLPALRPLLDRFNVSEDIRGARRRDQVLETRLATPEALTQANSLSAAFGRIGEQMARVVTAFGRNGFEPITQGLLHIGDALGELAQVLADNPMIGRIIGEIVKFFLDVAAGSIRMAAGLAKLLNPLQVVASALRTDIPGAVNMGIGALEQVGNGFLRVIEWIYSAVQDLTRLTAGISLPDLNLPDLKLPRIDLPTDDLKRSIDRNTDALGQATKIWREGFSGGGDRARGAIPGAMRGRILTDALRSQRLALGAFRL